jgi:hypothetical protein
LSRFAFAPALQFTQSGNGTLPVSFPSSKMKFEKEDEQNDWKLET